MLLPNQAEIICHPTLVLFKDRQEVARYTGDYGANPFRQWLANQQP
jgi:hypothetical protein